MLSFLVKRVLLTRRISTGAYIGNFFLKLSRSFNALVLHPFSLLAPPVYQVPLVCLLLRLEPLFMRHGLQWKLLLIRGSSSMVLSLVLLTRTMALFCRLRSCERNAFPSTETM
jgi:hypothetical protein